MTSSPFRLDGRVALVTGSSKGLGRAMLGALAAAGAKVVMNYAHDKARAEQEWAALQAQGVQGMLASADVTDPASVTALVERITTELGGLDILVVNATPAQPQLPIEQYDWDFYQSMLDHFVKSPYLLTRAALPHMKAQGWGRIINIGSEVVDQGTPNFSAYVAAKGGQDGWSRSMARELAPFGITVNLIAPGWIPVERHADEPQEQKDGYLATIPAGRWGVPGDLAGAVTFLASDAASFVTGQKLSVNGGMTVG